MEYPVKAVPYITVELGSHQALLRGQHVVIPRVARAGGIEKTYPAPNPLLHILIIPAPFAPFQAAVLF
jgi:hypothetical protein